jgi:low temperature requirement protein LtrA
MIIAVGESILSTGRTYASVNVDRWVLITLAAAFIGSVALWWTYFGRSSGEASRYIEHSDDPGRLGRAAYTYAHLPMVLGIIVVAVGDEMSIAHPTGETSLTMALMMVGGPALFLAGHVLFKFAIWERISVPHFVAIAVLLALIPIRTALSPVALAAISTAIVITLNLWYSKRRHYDATTAAGVPQT